MAKVLICDPVADDALNVIRQAGHEVVVKTGMDQDTLVETIPGFDAMVVRSATKVRVPVLDQAKDSLKLVVRGGVGVDSIDVDHAEKLGIAVKNTPAASSVAVAELALAHMLACCRGVTGADHAMKEGRWEKKSFSKGKELFQSTLGLIGFGRIAKETARRAQAFGMNIVFHDPYATEDPSIAAKKVDLETLCKQADFISLHVPHNDETHHILDASKFALMKQGTVIVNCGRGGTIDEESLLQAIESGTVHSAGLDVFECEPLTGAESPLVKSDKVVASPHVGAGTVGASSRVGAEVASIIVDFFK
jgi:D-3-phosphoglycerate dehydrogenase